VNVHFFVRVRFYATGKVERNRYAPFSDLISTNIETLLDIRTDLENSRTIENSSRRAGRFLVIGAAGYSRARQHYRAYEEQPLKGS
jgi:hypothetical protein